MGVIFSLLAALSYGTADFAGGYASRENPISGVLVVSQLFGIGVVLIFALLDPVPTAVSLRDLLYGVGAGIAGLAGLGLLYRGIATNEVSIVSPAAALFGALVPLLYGFAIGERLSTLALAGVAITFPAIVMISWEGIPEDLRMHLASRRDAWITGIAAGISFGLFFIFISRPPESTGMWPLVAARTASIIGVVLFLLARRRPLGVKKKVPVVVAAGVLDMLANIFLVLGYRSGLVGIVVMITSIYPAQTVFLGRIVFGQRVGLIRVAGIGLAIIGVILMSIG